MTIWQQLVRCAECGGSNEGELLDKLAKGHSRLWPIEGGCLVIDRTVDGAALAWLGVGKGRLKALAKQEGAIAAMARADGCRVLRIHGRRGWIKIFPHWEVTGHDGELVVMELKL